MNGQVSMESCDSCVALLNLLDKLTWDYLRDNVDFFEELVGWTWESYSQCIEIHYIGHTWKSNCLTVLLKDLLEWAKKGGE